VQGTPQEPCCRPPLLPGCPDALGELSCVGGARHTVGQWWIAVLVNSGDMAGTWLRSGVQTCQLETGWEVKGGGGGEVPHRFSRGQRRRGLAGKDGKQVEVERVLCCRCCVSQGGVQGY